MTLGSNVYVIILLDSTMLESQDIVSFLLVSVLNQIELSLISLRSFLTSR